MIYVRFRTGVGAIAQGDVMAPTTQKFRREGCVFSRVGSGAHPNSHQLEPDDQAKRLANTLPIRSCLLVHNFAVPRREEAMVYMDTSQFSIAHIGAVARGGALQKQKQNIQFDSRTGGRVYPTCRGYRTPVR